MSCVHVVCQLCGFSVRFVAARRSALVKFCQPPSAVLAAQLRQLFHIVIFVIEHGAVIVRIKVVVIIGVRDGG